MNHFYVLRNNREAGPFTYAELKAHGILFTDLLWVDGESKEWKHPADIEGLEVMIGGEAKSESSAVKKEDLPTISTSQPLPLQSILIEKTAAIPIGPALPNDYNGEIVFKKKKSKAAIYTIGAQLFGVAVVLIGLALCGFVVINMLKQFIAKPAAASEAVLINAETLPASNTAHTAQAPHMQKALTVAPIVENKDSLLAEASLKKQTMMVADAKALKAKAKPVNKTSEKTQTVAATDMDETPPAEVPEEKPEPAKPLTPSSLQVSANDYNVGFFGGVSNLQITVANPSGQSVSKAVVEIEYLKPNGNVVKTQTVTAENIAAGGSKTIPVLSSSRGVKVRYHVVNVE